MVISGRKTTATAKEYADLMRQGFKAMGEQMGQMQSQMKELEEQLKNLPPEQRRAVEAMMKQAQQSAAQVGPTGKPEECVQDKVDVKGTGKRYQTDFVHVWTITDGRVTAFREFLDTAAVAAAFA